MEHLKNGTFKRAPSPFRFLPDFSTTPPPSSRIDNPFDSPSMEKYSGHICSPNLFKQFTPEKNDEFKWSIEEIAMLKPAEFDTSYFELQQNSSSPNTEARIQEKISAYFKENLIVPSPGVERNFDNKPFHEACKTSLGMESVIPKHVEEILKSDELTKNEEKNYTISPDTYHKKLFEVGARTFSSPASMGSSPLVFSPIEELCSGITIRLHRSSNCLPENEMIGECVLSPITPSATETSDHSSCKSNGGSKSVCRLF